jgi:hypothetical protein
MRVNLTKNTEEIEVKVNECIFPSEISKLNQSVTASVWHNIVALFLRVMAGLHFVFDKSSFSKIYKQFSPKKESDSVLRVYDR